MKLSEALAEAKEALDDYDHFGLPTATRDLIEAVEAYLEAERRHADTIVGLADLQRWDGGQ